MQHARQQPPHQQPQRQPRHAASSPQPQYGAHGANVSAVKRPNAPMIAVTVAVIVALAVIFAFGAIAYAKGTGGLRSAASSIDSTKTASSLGITSFNAADISSNGDSVSSDFAPLPAILDGIDESDEIVAFSLSDARAPELSNKNLSAIRTTLENFDGASVGFGMYDVESGRGIGYNLDQQIYGASSFKAPYALYLCQKHIENGELTIPGLSDEDGTELFGAGGYTKILIENAICNSDNDSFAMLRSMYDANGYNEWVDELGIQDAAYTPDSWFPWYSVRSSLKIWTEMYNYWQTGDDAAQWLSSLCGETTVSFLRDVVDPLGATVRNKAGWCSGSDYGYDFNGVCDAGVIQLDGRTYVVSVMAGVPDCEENRELVENLIAAIFDARDALR
mgnify:FL=1